jgi:hypothetical protein
MLKKTLSLIFVIWLLVPMAAWLLRGNDPDRRDELAADDVPSPYGGALFKTDYYRALDRYINEQFIFRKRLKQVKNWVDYQVFSRTDRSDIHVGRQGWLYRRRDIENHIQNRCVDAGDVQRLLLELHAVEKVVTASGRRFRLLVVPSKASIYPEYIGWVPLPAGGRCSAYDLLREAQSAHPLNAWVPLASAIQAHKFGSHLLYDPTGSYWNGRGAAVAAEVLHRSVFKTTMLAPVRATSARDHDLQRLLLGGALAAAKDTVRQLDGLHPDGLGRGLVYADAGIDQLLPHLSQMARGLEIISTETLPSRQLSEDWRSFDSILIQTTESGISDLHIDLDRIYDQLAVEATGVRRTAVDMQALRSVAHTALSTVDGRLAIKTVGSRASFALIDLPGSYQRCFRVLRLSLSALRPERLTVEYRTYPPIRLTRAIYPDRFDLYLPLPVKSRVSLHFQPGGQAGLLILHAAEIIGFAERGADACGVTSVKEPPLMAAADSTPVRAEAAVRASPPTGGHKQSPPDPAPGKTVSSTSTIDRKVPRGEARSEAKVPATTHPPAATPSAAIAAERQGAGDDRAANPADHRDTTEKGSGTAAEIKAETVSAAGKDKAAAARSPAVETPPVSVTASITLNDIAEGRIFQRQDQKADIIVSGIYTGTVAGIEARVVRHGRGEAVMPWTVIDAAPRNGIFLGLLPGVPEGGWYALEVRTIGASRIVSAGRNRWGVGMLVACIGQSNMKEWFHTGGDLEADPHLRMFNADGWQEMGTRGNGAIAFGNRIIARTGIPVGLLAYAVNGSGLHRKADWGTGYWADTRAGSIYRQFVSAVDATGGKLEFVIWIQGEADAARGTVSGEDYQTALVRFINRQVRLDIANGSHRAHLPFLVVAMVKRPGGRDAPHQALREAQWAAVDQVAEGYLAATTLDLENRGKQHLAPEAYSTMGRRVAQTVLYVLGLESFYRGPRVATAVSTGPQALDLNLQHSGGSDVGPANGITGWEVLDRRGSAVILNVTRQDPYTLRILLARPLEGPTEVRYLYGAHPDTRRPLMDNASPPLPLEAFRRVIEVPVYPSVNNASGAVANRK